VTGVNIQTAESYWNRLKTKFKQMKGVSGRQLALHLDEFMWRECHGKTAGMAFRTSAEILREEAFFFNYDSLLVYSIHKSTEHLLFKF